MNRKKIMLFPIVGMLVITAFFAGCTTQYPSTQTPQLTITEPQNGTTIPSGNIQIVVQVSNFNLVNKFGSANVAGEGHIHYFIDVVAPTTPNQPAVTTSGSYAMSIATSYTWTNVTAGQHRFSAELVNNDHTPLQPPVTATVTVTVTSSPSGGGTTVIVDLMVKNFAFNKSSITVPKGAHVIVHFTNDDSNIPHNFAVYTSSAATTVIFQGKIITGVASTTYTFDAPSTPGAYFFRCDVHPNMMYGNFIVQ
jgi:plastocyanin